MAQTLNSSGRKNARKLAEAQARLAQKAQYQNSPLITPTTSIIPPFDRNNPVLELLSGLVFWPIFGVLWIVVKSARLFHRIFVKMPKKSFPAPFNPLGFLRLGFWIWLSYSIQTSKHWAGGFPWIGLEETATSINSFIQSHSLGFIYLPAAAYVLWAVIYGALGMICNLAKDNDLSGHSNQYNSSFTNINEALQFRDGEMNQKNSREKMETFASTGFLTNKSFNNPNMTDNELEAARFLDGELAMQSSRGKLEMLKDLFAGRR